LLATGDTKLLEGNRWHDNFWGNCDCPNCRDKPGLNYLGKILMRVRLELRTGSLDTISIKLPDGKYLTAHSIIRTAHPVINIYLDRPDGTKEILCFAEYNPGRPEGLELCVGAYRAYQWIHTHFNSEDQDYISMEYRAMRECGKIMRRIPRGRENDVQFLMLRWRYFQFETDQSFRVQYARNMAILKKELEKLAK